MTGSCKKCGNIWVDATYDKEKDKMIFVCSCGYSWTAEPLEKG